MRTFHRASIALAVAVCTTTMQVPPPAAPAVGRAVAAVAQAPRTPHVLDVSPARGLAVVEPSSVAQVLRYRMRSVRGTWAAATGLMLLPEGEAPAGGWPFVVYNHVTTGSADMCDPSEVTPGNSERERMTRGDDIAIRLLRAGVAVLRPDFEGIGTPGPHPYLIGRSLAASVVAMVRAAREHEPRLGADWVVVGHSEGSVGALFTGAADQWLPRGTRLRGVVALTPVTRMDTTLELLRRTPVAAPGVNGMVALAGMIIGGAATVDAPLRRLLTRGGLSDEAVALLPHLEQRCLVDLPRSDSWGGLAPSAVTGARGEEAIARLIAVMRANDVRRLHLRPGLPVRIDAGILDAVAPLPFTEMLVRDYRAAGVPITYARWPAGHPEVVDDRFAAGPVVAWTLTRLGR
ncbi:lipase family protein [Nocardioides sp. R-C-SC26]|uniref:lipase family protein n=1 Tax=Nocardioides sp. R-C-SC26 TaxID=2870414 RepID=UPI001E363191|nr:lipase family protein [Nocardioides sp. R-C-SC26]